MKFARFLGKYFDRAPAIQPLQPLQVFFKKSVLKSFAIFTGKYLYCGVFLTKFIKERLQCRCFPVNIAHFMIKSILKSICERLLPHPNTGANDRSFYPIFNKKFYHLLTIHRPKKVLSAGSLSKPLTPSAQTKCPKRTFILPPKVSCFSFKFVIIAT